jgi:hypothetical protein
LSLFWINLFIHNHIFAHFLKEINMQEILTSLTNPVWANAEQTAIDCEITTSQFGDEVLPFTASQNDVEAHGRAIFQDIVSGAYGPIGEYVAPPEPVQPTVVGAQTL